MTYEKNGMRPVYSTAHSQNGKLIEINKKNKKVISARSKVCKVVQWVQIHSIVERR